MTTIVDSFDPFGLTEHSPAVIHADKPYGFLNSQEALFDTKFTPHRYVVFDKSENDLTLVPSAVYGSDGVGAVVKNNGVSRYTLDLAYLRLDKTITRESFDNIRVTGTDATRMSLVNAVSETMTNMNARFDQTEEYMKIQALKGNFTTPDGVTVANMFTEFGLTQHVIDLELNDPTTIVDTKIMQISRLVAKEASRSGTAASTVVMLEPVMFDRLISHSSFVNIYNGFINRGVQNMTDNISANMPWGSMQYITHRGVTFVCYDATFTLPNGTAQEAFAENTGLAYANGLRGLFRSYYGPSARIDGGNLEGQKRYSYSYGNAARTAIHFNMEMAPLHFCTNPASLVKVISS